MNLKDYNTEIEALDKEMAELSQKRSKLREERKALIIKSKFKWMGVEFKVKDIVIYDDYYYDDCPYTPGYRYSGKSIILNRKTAQEDYRRYLTLPSEIKSWHTEKVEEWKAFQEFFRDKFKESVGSIIPSVENKR